MTRLQIALAAGYVAAGVVAFGHCEAKRQAEIDRACVATPERSACLFPFPPGLMGAFAGALWPLYVSKELWSRGQ